MALLALAADATLSPMALSGSPFAQALGARLLSVDLQDLRVELAFDPGPLFTQAAGVLHGGVVCSMLDFALALAALCAVKDGQSVATASIAVSCLRPARVGEIRAVGRVDRAGRQVAFTVAELHGSDGRLIASASSVLAVVDRFEKTP